MNQKHAPSLVCDNHEQRRHNWSRGMTLGRYGFLLSEIRGKESSVADTT